MQPELIIQIDTSAEYDREVIHRLVNTAMGKVDSYLKKYENKPDATVRIEFFVKKNSDDSFHGKLRAHIDGEVILFDRENFRKLDDLINHAFQHLKEQLAK